MSTTPLEVITPIEHMLRDYLRGRETLMAHVNDDPRLMNMDWKAPGNTDVNPTRVTFYRAGGPIDLYLPFETAAITFHCQSRGRPAAARLAVAVAREVLAITQADKPLRGGSVESINWSPADNAARYVVTALVTAIVPVLVT